jgi:hypothetical protein
VTERERTSGRRTEMAPIEPRTSRVSGKLTATLLRRFRRLCQEYGIDEAEAIYRAVDAWVELLDPGGKG